MTPVVKLGYVALTDALPLLSMQHLKLDQEYGFRLKLIKMGSWAQLRDALLTGTLNAAHCLPGIVLQSQCCGDAAHARLATAFTLNHFGNAITLSQRALPDPQPGEFEPSRSSLSEFLQAAAKRRAASGHSLTFASVFHVSKHEFELRHWLSLQGLDIGRDVRLVVLPPERLVNAMQEGRIDGFCVGEPWNSIAVQAGLGRIVTNSRQLGLPSTEKVLAVNEQWIESTAHHALLPALHHACNWLANPENHQTALGLLANTVGQDAEILKPGLSGPHAVDFSASHCPNNRHAVWFLQQMATAGLIAPHRASIEVAQRAFRHDIYEDCANSAPPQPLLEHALTNRSTIN